MTAFLRRVRRRLRLAWLVATGQLVLPFAAAGGVALLAASRLRPWSWPEPAALVVVIGTALLLVAAAAVVHIPLPAAARAADRTLVTGDAFATSLELDRGLPAPDPFAERITARASALAAGRTSARFVPIAWRTRRSAVVVGLFVLVVALLLAPNPQDDVRARLASERAAARAEADQLRRTADELRRLGEPQARVAATLDRAAADLDRADDLAAAERALERAAQRLADGISGNALSEKAAVRGLERSLQSRPLAGAEGGTQEQLRAAAEAVGALPADALDELAARLEALAATQTSGSPETAAALADAATALRDGDLAGAEAAIGEAALAHGAASESVDGHEASASALGQVATSATRLAGRAGGEGQEQGQGQGQGQGAGGGSPSGQVGGSGGGDAGEGGRGGAGTVGGQGGDRGTGSGVGESSVVAPVRTGTDGETIVVPGHEGAGPTETIGRGNGPTRLGRSRVPVRDALPTYRAQAGRALDQLELSPSTRALVRSYFDSLAAQS